MRIPLNVPLYIFLILIAFFGFLFSVFVQQNISLSIFLIFIAVGGFVLSFYIFYIKLGGKQLVCPTGSDCNAVIYSKYSKFFGVPLEYWGMLYYAFIASIYTTLVVSPSSISQSVTFIAFVVTSAAFLFSLYLTAVQGFALKQWCMWCLLSAVFSSVIFIVSLSELTVGISFLLKIYSGLLVTHLLAFSLGVGGATIVGVLFFRFIRDYRISEIEKGILQTIYQVMWFALGILVLTEFALYLPVAETLNASPQFLAKMLVIIAITVSWVLLNLVITPMLVAITFSKNMDNAQSEFIRLRKITFGLGAIAISSWYFAFVLDVVPNTSMSFQSIIAIYGLFLIAAIVISQASERKIASHSGHLPNPHQGV